MQIAELVSFLNQFAPLKLQESYDNCGLLLGDSSLELKSVLTSIDITNAVVDEAIQLGCNFILAHHPFIFQGLKQITPESETGKIIFKAIENKVSIFAMHTNLDSLEYGVNHKICQKLGLLNCQILKPSLNQLSKLVTYVPTDHLEKIQHAVFEAGAGHIGNYDQCSFNIDGTGTFRGLEGSNPFVGEKGKKHFEKETRFETIFPAFLKNKIINALLKNHPYEEVAYDIYKLENSYTKTGMGMIGYLKNETDELTFLKQVKNIFECKNIKYTPLLHKKIKKIAVCGGSGSFLIHDAITAGADIFITSDLKYHQFFDAENKMVIADIGHWESEHFTNEIFYEIVTKKFPTFAVHISKVKTNPINYL